MPPAAGSDSIIPPIDGVEEAGYWTNREATTEYEIPRSAVPIGAGLVGIELGEVARCPTHGLGT